MRRNLLTRFLLFTLLFASFITVPMACSSDDGSSTAITPPEPEPEPEPEPAPEADPTNENTTINASAPAAANGVSTVIVTVQLADANGDALTESGGTVALTATGSAEVSEVTDNGDGTYTASITNTTQENATINGTVNEVAITDEVDVTFNPDDSNPAQEVTQSTEVVGESQLRINCGGPEVAFEDVIFMADKYFSDNSKAYTNPLLTAIEGTEMDAIFLTERVTKDEVPRNELISYKIPATDGTYTVKLYFAEIYWGVENPDGFEGGPGTRIFDIIMEGTPIFTGYDLIKDQGVATAGTRMYDVEVSDGELTIELSATKDRPKISAIEFFGTGTLGTVE